MKGTRRQKLFCIVLIAALLTQCVPAASAARDVPEACAGAGGDAAAEPAQQVYAAAELPRRYDLREQGFVTPSKNQAGANSCWAFSVISAMESSYILQGYGTPENTDFSEAHLVWFSQRQRTSDASDLTRGDGIIIDNPYAVGGDWNRTAATLMRGSGLQLEQNARWIATQNENEMMQMQQQESDRYVSHARLWSATQLYDGSRDHFKLEIIQKGAATLSYYDNGITMNDPTQDGYSADRKSYYQTEKDDVWNHAVAVAGWDDDYPRTNFNANRRPSSNGAWLVKGSWGPSHGDNGYYWISYEEPSLCTFVSYVTAPTDIYDHIYQYDGAWPSYTYEMTNTGKMANVFTAERDELLTHVAFCSKNKTPVKVTAEVYVAPEDFTYSRTNPVSGFQKISAATKTVENVAYGYTTIELSEPILLRKGRLFTVVVTFESDGKVLIPVEGPDQFGNISYSSRRRGDSFVLYVGRWIDTRENEVNNVPVKAMTRDVTLRPAMLMPATQPDKTVYRVGETLDTTGLVLEYTNEIGMTETVTSGFTCDVTTLSAIGMQTVTVEYKDTYTSFDVTVEPYTRTLTVLTPPDRTKYTVGDTLDTSGLSLLYSDEYGETHEITQGFVCDPTELLSIGTQTVQAAYGDLSASFDVTVSPFEPTLTLRTLPDKMTYIVGETLDTTGMTLDYTDEYGKRMTVKLGYVCTPQTLQMIGTQTVSASYRGLSVSFDVTVEPHELTLAILSLPKKTTYLYGETLDTDGLSLMYTDRYGKQYLVTGGFYCQPSSFYTFGTQTVTVMYNVLSVTFDVTVEPHVPTLSVLTPPDRTAYLYGETIDTTGLTLRYTDMYGEAHTVTEGYVCEPDVLNTVGTQTVRAVYQNLAVTFDVTVDLHEPTLTLLSAPDTMTFSAGQTPDLAGMSLLYTDEYGEQTVVTDGFQCETESLHTLGSQTVTVTYMEFSVTFDVTVVPIEPMLTLQFLPDKTNYLIGETLDTTGMMLFYTDEAADTVIVTDGFACMPGTFQTPGLQTVTVMYGDLTATFEVTVQQTGLFLATDTTARAGETIEVAVRIPDNPGIIAAWLEILYDPQVLTLEGVENGTVFRDADFTPGYDLSAMPFRVLFMDALSAGNYTQTGDLAVFRFRVRADARPGESTIELTYDADSTYDADLENVPFRIQNGTCTVRRSPGDVNADGLVDLKDAAVLRRYLAGWDVTVNLSNADVDRQGDVNLKDAARICRYLAEGYNESLL